MKKHFKHSNRKSGPVIRAIGVICAVIAMASGVTYAALQSQRAILAGSTIQSASAALLVSSDGTNYSQSVPGFNFQNVEPGGAPSPSPNGYQVYLKNTGTTNLNLHNELDGNELLNPDHLDLSKVSLILTPVTGNGTVQTLSLFKLLGYNNLGGGPLNISIPAGVTDTYRLQVSMAADAVSGTTSSVSLSGFDLMFSGVTN